jgi:RNA polymerase sigma-70 factor (ECF subfamily)
LGCRLEPKRANLLENIDESKPRANQKHLITAGFDAPLDHSGNICREHVSKLLVRSFLRTVYSELSRDENAGRLKMLSSKSFALGEKELEAVAPAAGSAFALADVAYIEKLKSGDADAFDKLVIRYSNDIYALLFRLTSDAEEASDLTQETFLRALRAISGFRGESDLKTWLYRIAINESRNRFRWWKRRRRDTTVSLDETLGNTESSYQDILADSCSSPEEDALRREREAILQKALRDLPAIYREPVVLFDIEGLSYDEICKALDLNPGTLKSRLARGRQELKKRLAGY